ncbi:transposase [Sporolactobacillus nakayamae]|uniref:Transposase IS200 like n=1 Tax=Sporolactobacillus nakayamae TaxID=269670 RepID=A0A1I2VZN4_9BACL|nr:Transposase IS200 like [Sporolactobacillus nakayamae]
MQYLKGRSSRLLQDEFPELKKRYCGQHLWPRGYFCTTVGGHHDRRNHPYYAANQSNKIKTTCLELMTEFSQNSVCIEHKAFQKTSVLNGERFKNLRNRISWTSRLKYSILIRGISKNLKIGRKNTCENSSDIYML